MQSRQTRVTSSNRFALIRPGDPSPELLLASKDDVDDLLGFYSAKRFGLNLFDVPQASTAYLFFRSVLVETGPEPKAGEFEEWVKVPFTDIKQDHRSTEYTLVVEGQSIEGLPARYKEQVQSSFKNLLTEFLTAKQKNDDAGCKHYGTLIAALINKVDYFAFRHNANRTYRNLAFLFVLAAAMLSGIVAIVSASFAN